MAPLSIKQQIMMKCIHFTGLGKDACKKEIRYDSFGPPFQEGKCILPCIGGSNQCSQRENLTEEEAEKEVEEMNTHTMKLMKLITEAKSHWSKTKLNSAKIKCPNGDHEFNYVRAITNGHFWIGCKGCGITMNE